MTPSDLGIRQTLTTQQEVVSVTKKSGKKEFTQFPVTGYTYLEKEAERMRGSMAEYPARYQFCLTFQFPDSGTARMVPLTGEPGKAEGDWSLKKSGTTTQQVRHRMGQLMEAFPLGAKLNCFPTRKRGGGEGEVFWKLAFEGLPPAPKPATVEDAKKRVAAAVMPYRRVLAGKKAAAKKPAGKAKILSVVADLQKKHGKASE